MEGPGGKPPGPSCISWPSIGDYIPSWLFGCPSTRQLLRFRDLSRRHPFAKLISGGRTHLFSVRATKVIPFVGLDKVLPHTFPMLVHKPQFSEGQSIPLLCR